ncbi:MAG: hypothetical protein RR436_04290, partial [Clostridia bacterium]
ATDFSKNTSATKDTAQDSTGTPSGGIVVDSTKPTIEVTYNTDAPTQTIGDTDFYKNNVILTFKVTETNFYAEDINVDVVAKDVNGKIISSIDVEAMKATLKKASSWTHSGSIHTATLKLTTDAYYNVSVNYTDKSKNMMNEYTSRRICLDKVNPDNLEIKYNTNPFRAFLNAITFNLFQNKIDVTIKATDVTAGVQFIEWQYVGESGLNNLNSVNVSSDANQKKATRIAGTNDYTVSFEISAQFKGEIKATAVDFATNRSDADPAIDSIEIVDTISPVIAITYPNDVAPSVRNGVNYYKSNRTTNVQITEDNFVTSTTEIIIKKDNQVYNAITPTNWTTVGNVHTKEFTFDEDGDYTFEVYCKDVVGRETSVTEKAFTLDKTAPILEITYDNYTARNTNYYDANRTATIKVNEHNWNESDFVLNLVSEDNPNGAYETIASPTLSTWSTSGDIHTATIHFSSDAKNTLSASYTDVAENKGNDIANQVFFIDKTNPVVPKTLAEIAISGYVNGKGKTVAPTFDVKDKNIEKMTYSVTGKDRAGNNISSIIGSITDITNGKHFAGANIAEQANNDGVYTLTITATDKAGRATTSPAITFSVNRFGSTFDLSAADSINSGYHKNVTDVVFKELNPNAVVNDAYVLTLSRNGNIKELVLDKDFSRIDNGSANGKWSEYTYTIKAELFKEDGKYIITLKDRDEANNQNNSDDVELKLGGKMFYFAIYNTKPTAAVSGIENNKMYNDDSVKATISVNDNIKLKSVKLTLNGKEATGKVVEENDTSYKLELDVASAFERQNLEISYIDEAGNENTTKIENFLVNSNIFVQYYQNKTLFFGSIAGLLIIILGLAAFFIFRRKKAV